MLGFDYEMALNHHLGLRSVLFLSTDEQFSINADLLSDIGNPMASKDVFREPAQHPSKTSQLSIPMLNHSDVLFTNWHIVIYHQ